MNAAMLIWGVVSLAAGVIFRRFGIFAWSSRALMLSGALLSLRALLALSEVVPRSKFEADQTTLLIVCVAVLHLTALALDVRLARQRTAQPGRPS
jgi:membrane-bound ClpP family serine protease